MIHSIIDTSVKESIWMCGLVLKHVLNLLMDQVLEGLNLPLMFYCLLLLIFRF